jgi:hypothetical protein
VRMRKVFRLGIRKRAGLVRLTLTFSRHVEGSAINGCSEVSTLNGTISQRANNDKWREQISTRALPLRKVKGPGDVERKSGGRERLPKRVVRSRESALTAFGLVRVLSLDRLYGIYQPPH